MAVHFADLFRRRGAPAADRPDRLVSHHDLAFALRQGAGELGAHHGQGPTGLALVLGLADADDGDQASAERRLGLGPHQGIAFPVIGAPLGMANDDVAAAGIGQHGRGDVARVGAFLGRMAVLGPQLDRAAGKILADRQEKVKRRANQEIAGRRLVRQQADEIARQAAARRHQSVHLPIARDQLPPHAVLSIRSRIVPRIAIRPWRPWAGRVPNTPNEPRPGRAGRGCTGRLGAAAGTPICRLPASGPLPKMRPPRDTGHPGPGGRAATESRERDIAPPCWISSANHSDGSSCPSCSGC
jgi:hypothetical protein